MLTKAAGNYRDLWQRCRTRFGEAAALSLACKVLGAAILAPVTTGFLRLCLLGWGRPAAGNFEIAAFLLSPAGLVALSVMSSLALAGWYIEMAGLLRLLGQANLSWWQALGQTLASGQRLETLAVRQLAVLLPLALLFLAGIAAAYVSFWHGRDLNGLIILKPPEFWWGAGIAAALVVFYVLIATRWWFRWLISLPILLFEPQVPPRQALQFSAERMQGRIWQAASWIAIWLGLQFAIAMLVLGPLEWLTLALLEQFGSTVGRAVLIMGLMAATHAIVTALLGVVANIGLASIVLQLYLESVAIDVAEPSYEPPVGRRLNSWALASGIMAVFALSLSLCYAAVRDVHVHADLEITAHRAGAVKAPENTIEALEQAILDKADWAEIDVQLTADKRLVVMHDTDLARIGGGSRAVGSVTADEIFELDLGAVHGQQFAGVRVPELSKLLAAAKGKIRLNVELKPHGKQDVEELTTRVVKELQSAGLAAESRICSQSYESLQLARQLEPELTVGYIVATAIGDPLALAADFLMVKQGLATPRFVARARQRGMKIHAWTVNSPESVAPLIDAGIDNIITDDPALIRAEVGSIRDLNAVERLLLSAQTSIRG